MTDMENMNREELMDEIRKARGWAIHFAYGLAIMCSTEEKSDNGSRWLTMKNVINQDLMAAATHAVDFLSDINHSIWVSRSERTWTKIKTYGDSQDG